MLRSLQVGGFKSYKSLQTLTLAPLTVLIGANASGKSNLIEAMQLLAWLARSHRLGDLAHALREREILVRGRVADLPAPGEDIVFGCEIEDLVLSLTLRIDERGPRITEESLTLAHASLPYYRVMRAAEPHSNELRVAYNNFARGKNKPEITCVDYQAVFTQLTTPARFESRHQEAQRTIPGATTKVAGTLGEMLFLDPQPGTMRQYSYKDERQLLGNGSNVSSVLHDLCVAQDRSTEVLEFIRSLPEQDIRQVQFLDGPRNDVMLQLRETFGKRERVVDAAVLSDGTLRVLAVAAAVLSVTKGSLVVIEEIDNGVHPSRAKLIMDGLYRVARARGIQLLLTTHNPALLDAVPPAAIGDTVACYRDPESGDSRLQRLEGMDDFAALVGQGPLGWLATSGTLDRYLKLRKTRVERERQANDTMELFRRAK